MSLILDKSMFWKPTPRGQAYRLQELVDAGCKVKLHQPRAGKYAYMHMKSCSFDCKVLLTGSVNFTHNGFENSAENLIRIEDAEEFVKHSVRFEELWREAEDLRADDLAWALELRERG